MPLSFYKVLLGAAAWTSVATIVASLAWMLYYFVPLPRAKRSRGRNGSERRALKVEMSSAAPNALVDRRLRLEALQRRLRGRLRLPAATVKVSRAGEVALLRGLSAEELREFARGCQAHVVSRVGGEEFDFSFAGPPESLDS